MRLVRPNRAVNACSRSSDLSKAAVTIAPAQHAVRTRQARTVTVDLSVCAEWHAARAARGRAIAAWASDLLALRACGIHGDRVSFAGFAVDVPGAMIAPAD